MKQAIISIKQEKNSERHHMLYRGLQCYYFNEDQQEVGKTTLVALFETWMKAMKSMKFPLGVPSQSS